MIVPNVSEYEITFPELPKDFELVSMNSNSNNKYIFLKCKRFQSNITQETISINLTSIRDNVNSNFKVYYLIRDELDDFEGKMKKFVEERLVLY